MSSRLRDSAIKLLKLHRRSMHLSNRIAHAALGLGLLFVCLPGCAQSSASKTAAKPEYHTPAMSVRELDDAAKSAARRSPEAQEQLAQQLANGLRAEKDPIIRAHVLRTMGAIHSPTSTAMLRAGMADPDRDVRLACCEAWARQGGDEAADVLSETLGNDSDLDVRLASARILGELENRRGITALGQALEDANPAMQYRAVESLKRITGADYGNDVKAWAVYVQSGAPAPPETLASKFFKLF